MNLVKNQNHGVILMKCSLFIDEIKIHQCFCPFHHTKCHFFGVFRIKNIMFDDVLVPWVYKGFALQTILKQNFLSSLQCNSRTETFSSTLS